MGRRFNAAMQRVDDAGEPAPSGAPGGLVCTACGCRHFDTVKVEQRPWGIQRRKACRHCGRRITTREVRTTAGDGGETRNEENP